MKTICENAKGLGVIFMFKKVLTVLSLLVIATLALTGCGKSWGPVAGAAKKDAVTSNAGLVLTASAVKIISVS